MCLKFKKKKKKRGSFYNLNKIKIKIKNIFYIIYYKKIYIIHLSPIFRRYEGMREVKKGREAVSQ